MIAFVARRANSFASAALLLFLFSPAVTPARQSPGAGAPQAGLCTLSNLPPDVQMSLKEDLAMWKILEPEDLSESSRAAWTAEKPPACPGIAIGKFENGTQRSFAVLLVPRSHQDAGYKLLVFSHQPGQLSYATNAVEQSPNSPIGSFYLRALPVRKAFDGPSRKAFHPEGSDGIVFVDPARQKEAAFYFWSKGAYRRQTVKR